MTKEVTNERIRELAEEAYFDCDISTNIKIPKEFVEKFAEFIVKECIDIVAYGGEFASRINLVEKLQNHIVVKHD